MNKDYKSLTKYSKPKNMIKEGYSIKAEVITTEGEYTVCHFHVEDIFSDELFLLVLCYVSKYGSDLKNDIDLPWILTYISMQNDLIHFLNKDIEAFESTKKAIPFDIIYVDSLGNASTVLLPDIDVIFEDDTDYMIEYMTKLFIKFADTYKDLFDDYDWNLSEEAFQKLEYYRNLEEVK